MKLIKTLAIAALFFITASTSTALANDLVSEPQGALLELDVSSTHTAAEQTPTSETETSTTSSTTDVNDAVIKDLRNLNDQARKSFMSGDGWQ